MVIFSIILPLVVLVIIGFLYGTNPAANGGNYTFWEQSIRALCAISICAGGLIGLPLVVAEYREQKILKRFQVTPVSRRVCLKTVKVTRQGYRQDRQQPGNKGLSSHIWWQSGGCF